LKDCRILAVTYQKSEVVRQHSTM